MGFRLSLLAAVIASAALVHDAAADDAKKARELFDKGIAEYKAAHYEQAAALLAASYAYAAKPDALFAQAQAERLAGHCDRAIEHYQQVLAQSKDAKTTRAVEAKLALCPQPEPEPEPPKPVVVVEPVQPRVDIEPPRVVTRTVVRDTRHTDKLAAFMAASGGISLGVSVGFFLAARSTSDDAGRARTLDASNELYDRAARERLVSYVTGGVGVAMVGFAAYRWITGGGSATTKEVAIVPAHGGTMLSLSSRW